MQMRIRKNLPAIEDYEETTPTTPQRMFPELQILTVPKEVLEEDREKHLLSSSLMNRSLPR